MARHRRIKKTKRKTTKRKRRAVKGKTRRGRGALKTPWSDYTGPGLASSAELNKAPVYNAADKKHFADLESWRHGILHPKGDFNDFWNGFKTGATKTAQTIEPVVSYLL